MRCVGTEAKPHTLTTAALYGGKRPASRSSRIIPGPDYRTCIHRGVVHVFAAADGRLRTVHPLVQSIRRHESLSHNVQRLAVRVVVVYRLIIWKL